MALRYWMYGCAGAAALAGAVWFTPNVIGAVSDRYRNVGQDEARVHYDPSGADYVKLCDEFKIPKGRIRGNELVRDDISIGPDGREKINKTAGFPLDHLILEVRVNPANPRECELIGLRDPRPAQTR